MYIYIYIYISIYAYVYVSYIHVCLSVNICMYIWGMSQLDRISRFVHKNHENLACAC